MLWPREVGGLLQLVPAPLSSAMIVFRTSSPEVEKMFDPPCAAFREIVRLSRLAEPLVLWIPPPVASPPAPGAAAAEPPLPPVPPPDAPPPPPGGGAPGPPPAAGPPAGPSSPASAAPGARGAVVTRQDRVP